MALFNAKHPSMVVIHGPIAVVDFAVVDVAVGRTDAVALHDNVLHAALPLDDAVAAQVAVGNRGWFARIVICSF